MSLSREPTYKPKQGAETSAVRSSPVWAATPVPERITLQDPTGDKWPEHEVASDYKGESSTPINDRDRRILGVWMEELGEGCWEERIVNKKFQGEGFLITIYKKGSREIICSCFFTFFSFTVGLKSSQLTGLLEKGLLRKAFKERDF